MNWLWFLKAQFDVAKFAFIMAVLLLAGCAAPQTKSILSQPLDPTHTIINDVPFYPQQDYYCGPTTLVEVLNFYGESFTPEEIAPSLFIPDRDGSLQIEMVSSVRQRGYLAYQESLKLQELMDVVASGTPVIVLQNNGLSWYPAWHYAVVIGYDIESEALILHTGQTPNRLVDMSVFERTWERAKKWALIPLPVNGLPSGLRELPYIQAAQDLLTVGKVEKGIQALETADGFWQSSELAALLLGNFYIDKDLKLAKAWLQKAYSRNKSNGALLNNYAHVLAELGCKKEALTLSQMAVESDETNFSYKNTLLSIKKLEVSADNVQDCSV